MDIQLVPLVQHLSSEKSAYWTCLSTDKPIIIIIFLFKSIVLVHLSSIFSYPFLPAEARFSGLATLRAYIALSSFETTGQVDKCA
jgi:hypothetical protein